MNKKINLPLKILILTAFFLSGGCGLVYEVLWTRYLADLIGSTSLSQMVVLMVFMGGLSLGALLFGRLVDRHRNGLLFFGWLELGIGLYAVCFPFFIEKVEVLFLMATTNLQPGSSGLFFMKIMSAILLIAIPSVSMGATLPVLTRYLTGSRTLLRRNISLLYGFNSLGAVLGVLAGGFYLVHHYGMFKSMIFTGMVSILLGLVALGIALYFDRKGDGRVIGVRSRNRRVDEILDLHVYNPSAVRRAVIGAGISGFAAMALQIAWIRYFVIVLGATHSSFTIVVAAFIFGIGLGSLLVSSRMVGRIPLPTVLAGAFALTTVTMGVGLFFYGRVPFEIGWALAIIARIPRAWPVYELLRFGICFTLMLLPTVASGMILPVCVRIVGFSSDWIGRDVARVYTVNTLGALLGIGITSQLLFRMFSLPRTLQIILFIYLGTTVFLTYVLEEKGRKRIFALIVVLALTHFIFWRPWHPEQLFIDRVDFRRIPPISYGDFLEQHKETVVVDDRQGPDVQVTVIDSSTDRDAFRTMYINGKPDASNDPNGPDLVTEILLAQLPMLLHPAPANVFVLGLGSGITSGEALKHPKVQQVVTVELAAEVFEAAKTFANDNGYFWKNPKHRMVIDDGKSFLQHTREKFDVIAMEPTNIWQEGMAGLFSEDFFRLAKSRLADGGVVAQWLHTYKVDNLTIDIVLKTFSQVFPKASIFVMGSGDILLVGYDEQWKFDSLNIEHNFYRPQILASMKKTGNVSPLALLLREVMGRGSFQDYTSVSTAPVNTSNFPVLEQAAEYGYFIRRSANILHEHDSRVDPDKSDLLLRSHIRRLGLDRAQSKVLLDSTIVTGNQRLLNSLLFKLMSKAGPGEMPPLLAQLSDPLLREVVLHPNYRRDPAGMAPSESYRMIGGELLIWSRAASQLWVPSIDRMQALYERTSLGGDLAKNGRLALQIALALGRERACGAALPFFRQAEEKGAMSMENMDISDVTTVFHCEVKSGDPQRAGELWQFLEDGYPTSIDEAVMRDKVLLDIKLGGEPPTAQYGNKLPPRW